MSDIVKLIWQKLWAQQQKFVLRIYLVIFHSKKQHLQKCIGSIWASASVVGLLFKGKSILLKIPKKEELEKKKKKRKKKWNILSSNGVALFCVQKFCVTEVNWKDVLIFSPLAKPHTHRTLLGFATLQISLKILL